jgi:hypothetical protein
LDWRYRRRQAAERRRLVTELPEPIARLLRTRNGQESSALLKLWSRSETGRPKQAAALPHSHLTSCPNVEPLILDDQRLNDIGPGCTPGPTST